MDQRRAVLNSGMFVGAVLLLGCELRENFEDLAQTLGNPDPQYIDAPGRLVAEGQFRNLAFDGTTADGAFVVALAEGSVAAEGEQPPPRHLKIVPFPEGELCDVGPAKQFARALIRTDDPDTFLDARIPLVVPAQDDVPDTLRFTNYACKLDKLKIAGSELPIADNFGPEPGFIVQDDQGQVLFVSPWKNSKRVLATNAAAIRRGDRALFAEGGDGQPWMWTLESGQVVARNSRFEEVFRTGQEIRRVMHHAGGNGGPLLVLEDQTGQLSTVFATDPNGLQVVAQDACETQVNMGQQGRELLFYAPCAERKLQVYELETATLREIRAQITDYKIVGATDTGPVLMYVTDPDEMGTGTLWVRWGQNEPIRLGAGGNLGLSRVTSTGEARVVVDWNGNGGTLLAGELGKELEPLAEAVAYQSSAGLITDFDGNNGVLNRFTEDRRLEKIAENISPRGIRNDNQLDRALFLSDFDGTEGDLVLITGTSVKLMAENVRPNAYQFTVQEKRVTLLADLDEATNTAVLKVPSTEYDDPGYVNTGVAESLEVDWPSRGLLYSAPAAKQPGIYFAPFY